MDKMTQLSDSLAITSPSRTCLQAAKKQNIVYSGRLSVTNALPVFRSPAIQITPLPRERRKNPVCFKGNSGVVSILCLKTDFYSLIHNILLMID